MNNYFNMIDSYLHGTLEPEEEALFERQLDRNPVLVDELTHRYASVCSSELGAESPVDDPISAETTLSSK